MKELDQSFRPMSAPFNTVAHDNSDIELHASRAPRNRLRKAIGRRVKPHLKSCIKRSAQWMLNAIAKFLPRPRQLPVDSEVRQIVVFGDMGIGNFVMLTPLLRALRHKFAAAEIVVIFIKGRGAEMVAERITSIDRHIHLHGLREGKFLDAAPFFRATRVHRLSPDLLIGRFSGSPYIPLLACIARPAWRVGHISSAGFNGFCDAIYNYPVAMKPDEHEVERNLNLALSLGAAVEGCGLEFELTDMDRQEAQCIITENNLDTNRLICLQMGSSEIQKWKRWPEESWAGLIGMLKAEGWEIGLVGSKGEYALAESIAAASGANVSNLCGSLSLGGTAALLQSARLLISNDSGLMHIAAAVDVPIIGLFGPTEYERTKPWTERFIGLCKPCSCNTGTLFDRRTLKLIEKCDRPCLAKTSSDEVMEAVRNYLG